MALFKNRLREIESSIRHYLEVQKGLEYRMAIFFDDSLRQVGCFTFVAGLSRSNGIVFSP